MPGSGTTEWSAVSLDKLPGATGTLRRVSRDSFDWWERWTAGRAALGLIFVWAVAEATVWPILPDFLLIPLVVGNRRRYYLPLAGAVLGMALGGTFLYLFADWDAQHALQLLQHLPTVRASKIAGARGHLAAHGVAAFLFQPWSGIPFKVWAIVAGTQGINPLLAIPTFIAARAARMTILATVARLLTGRFSSLIRDQFVYLILAYVLLFFSVWWQLLR
jgi:membrane protein YqaA with SNARE-associated domain